MNVTQVTSGRDYSSRGSRSRLLWVAIAILIVAAVVAMAAIWAAGLVPLTLAPEGLARGINADAARYAALGQYYASRGAEADSTRWAALGRSYMSGLTSLPFADASLFYSERMRALIQANPALGRNPALMFAPSGERELAANPELAAARRGYSALNELAANPELMAARRGYSALNELAANPELMAARRAYAAQLLPDFMSSASRAASCSPEGAALVATEGIVFEHLSEAC